MTDCEPSLAYERFNKGDATQKGRDPNLASTAKNITLYVEFHCLLTLNEVHLQHLLLIFIIKEAEFMREIGNDRDFYCLTFNGGMPKAHGLFTPSGTRH